MIAAAFAAVYFYLKPPTPPPAGPATVCTLYVNKSQGGSGTRTLAADDPLFAEVIDYLNTPSTRSGWWGVTSNLTSYVPGLVVRTDTIKLNFQETRVIVSTRQSPDDYWRQSVRSMNAKDLRIEAKLRKHLKSAPLKTPLP